MSITRRGFIEGAIVAGATVLGFGLNARRASGSSHVKDGGGGEQASNRENLIAVPDAIQVQYLPDGNVVFLTSSYELKVASFNSPNVEPRLLYPLDRSTQKPNFSVCVLADGKYGITVSTNQLFEVPAKKIIQFGLFDPKNPSALSFEQVTRFDQFVPDDQELAMFGNGSEAEPLVVFTAQAGDLSYFYYGQKHAFVAQAGQELTDQDKEAQARESLRKELHWQLIELSTSKDPKLKKVYDSLRTECAQASQSQVTVASITPDELANYFIDQHIADYNIPEGPDGNYGQSYWSNVPVLMAGRSVSNLDVTAKLGEVTAGFNDQGYTLAMPFAMKEDEIKPDVPRIIADPRSDIENIGVTWAGGEVMTLIETTDKKTIAIKQGNVQEIVRFDQEIESFSIDGRAGSKWAMAVVVLNNGAVRQLDIKSNGNRLTVEEGEIVGLVGITTATITCVDESRYQVVAVNPQRIQRTEVKQYGRSFLPNLLGELKENISGRVANLRKKINGALMGDKQVA